VSRKRLPREAAYRALLNSSHRHARNITVDQPGSKVKLFAPKLLATYEAECKRMSDFIREAEKSERRLNRIVEALRLMMSDKQFRTLLMSEGLVTLPTSLALRLERTAPQPDTPSPLSERLCYTSESQQAISGVCPEVLDVLQDYPVKVKIFGLLRKVHPARQVEIARLMIAMDRIRFTYAKMLVGLTPKSLLAEGFHPATIVNLTEDQICDMEPELSRLTRTFLDALERRGPASLELVVASRYLDHLMDNSRVVRYLARAFPGHFEEFHKLSMPVGTHFQ